MRYKRGVLAVSVVLILLSLVFSPGLSAVEKSNSGADLKIIAIYPYKDFYMSMSWIIDYYVVVKNVGDTTYYGNIGTYGCIRGIFNSNNILRENTDPYYDFVTLRPNHGVVIEFLSSPFDRFFPFFYEIYCEIITNVEDINLQNNMESEIMFLISSMWAFEFD